MKKNFIFMDTFIRLDDRWQVISTQATLVALEMPAINYPASAAL